LNLIVFEEQHQLKKEIQQRRKIRKLETEKVFGGDSKKMREIFTLYPELEDAFLKAELQEEASIVHEAEERIYELIGEQIVQVVGKHSDHLFGLGLGSGNINPKNLSFLNESQRRLYEQLKKKHHEQHLKRQGIRDYGEGVGIASHKSHQNHIAALNPDAKQDASARLLKQKLQEATGAHQQPDNSQYKDKDLAHFHFGGNKTAALHLEPQSAFDDSGIKKKDFKDLKLARGLEEAARSSTNSNSTADSALSELLKTLNPSGAPKGTNSAYTKAIPRKTEDLPLDKPALELLSKIDPMGLQGLELEELKMELLGGDTSSNAGSSDFGKEFYYDSEGKKVYYKSGIAPADRNSGGSQAPAGSENSLLTDINAYEKAETEEERKIALERLNKHREAHENVRRMKAEGKSYKDINSTLELCPIFA